MWFPGVTEKIFPTLMRKKKRQWKSVMGTIFQSKKLQYIAFKIPVKLSCWSFFRVLSDKQKDPQTFLNEGLQFSGTRKYHEKCPKPNSIDSIGTRNQRNFAGRRLINGQWQIILHLGSILWLLPTEDL